MKPICQAVFLALSLALLMACPGAAAEIDTNPALDTNRTLSPYFFVESGDPAVDRLPLKETRADVHIAGVIADVRGHPGLPQRGKPPDERALRLPGLDPGRGARA